MGRHFHFQLFAVHSAVMESELAAKIATMGTRSAVMDARPVASSSLATFARGGHRQVGTLAGRLVVTAFALVPRDVMTVISKTATGVAAPALSKLGAVEDFSNVLRQDGHVRAHRGAFARLEFAEMAGERGLRLVMTATPSMATGAAHPVLLSKVCFVSGQL